METTGCLQRPIPVKILRLCEGLGVRVNQPGSASVKILLGEIEFYGQERLLDPHDRVQAALKFIHRHHPWLDIPVTGRIQAAR